MLDQLEPLDEAGIAQQLPVVSHLPSRVKPWEAQQYDVYCWARDSATDMQGFSRANFMSQPGGREIVEQSTAATICPSTCGARFVQACLCGDGCR